MHIKKIIFCFIMILLLFYLIPFSIAETHSDTSNKTKVDSTETLADTSLVVYAYYFHRTHRCYTCIKMEEYTNTLIHNVFEDSLEDGKLVWEAINWEKSGNKHFVEDYQLEYPSLIIVKMKDGEDGEDGEDEKDGKNVEWKNLELIWDFVGNKEDFYIYVQNELEQYLAGS